MEKAIPIKTQIGILAGRDCINLDLTQFKRGNLILSGVINGNLVDCGDEWVKYKLNFERVLAYFSCELDTYEGISKGHWGESSFDVITDSEWLKTLPVRRDYDKKMYKHYRVFTYDVVYDIIAINYQLDINE